MSFSVAHDEGISVPLDNSNTAFMPRFFYKDHLGNTRLVYSVAPNGAYITQENHYGPYGEVLEGIGQSGDWKFLYQGKEYIDAFGLNMYDFGWRMGDSWAGRWPNLDPADQFQSMTGYGYMANNSVSLTDPDGRVVPLIIAGAAVIGGALNLYRNWGAVTNTKGGNWAKFAKGAAFFGLGAVEGAFVAAAPGAGFVGVAASAAGRAVLSGTVKSIGNVLLGGNPDQLNPVSILRDAAITGITAGTFTGVYSLFKGGSFLYGIPKVYADIPNITNVFSEAGEEVASNWVKGASQAHLMAHFILLRLKLKFQIIREFTEGRIFNLQILH